MAGEIKLSAKTDGTIEIIPQNSIAYGRNATFKLRKIFVDKGGNLTKDADQLLPTDVIIRCFSQKVGVTPPCYIVLDALTAKKFVDAVQRTIKEGENGQG